MVPEFDTGLAGQLATRFQRAETIAEAAIEGSREKFVQALLLGLRFITSAAIGAQLNKAISMARLHKATIVIGKQDRLARNAAFILNLMESGVEFVCADRPHQSRFETRLPNAAPAASDIGSATWRRCGRMT